MTGAVAIRAPNVPVTGAQAVIPPRAADGLRTIADLTRGLAAGSEEAFQEFHTRYFERLFRFSLVLTRGNEAAAKDVLQETLCRMARHARRFDDEEIFWCWLTVLARTAALDAGRKQHRYRALLHNYALRWLPLQAESTIAEENLLESLLVRCLSEMDAEDRVLVEGKYLKKLSVRELSETTGLTGKAVESRLARLRQQLRTRLIKQLGST